MCSPVMPTACLPRSFKRRPATRSIPSSSAPRNGSSRRWSAPTARTSCRSRMNSWRRYSGSAEAIPAASSRPSRRRACWRPGAVRSWCATATRCASAPVCVTNPSKTTSRKCFAEFILPKRTTAPEAGRVRGENQLTKSQTTHCFPAIPDYIASQRVRCARSLWPGFLFRRAARLSNSRFLEERVPVFRRNRASQDCSTRRRAMKLRNVAIIAHVDHGKTTLVDRLLQQSGTYRENQRVVERAMDSNDLERERGITILAKAASVQWKDTRINIVDTPGHADFGGEVERILNMVDGALVLVDAAEGPLPQTKFVVSKALKVGLKPIVVINKVDRPDARPTEVINEVFDLFAALDASEEQLDFPILYGSAKQGWMAETPDGSHDAGMQPLFDLILRHVAPPTVEDGPFRMIGTILEANPYLGRIITGRITSGTIKPNQAVKVLGGDGKLIETG